MLRWFYRASLWLLLHEWRIYESIKKAYDDYITLSGHSHHIREILFNEILFIDLLCIIWYNAATDFTSYLKIKELYPEETDV